jgi:hypothetical protein
MTKKEPLCRGDTFTTNLKYIKKKYGRDGLDKVQEELKKRKSSLVLKELKDLEWYPLHERKLFLEAVYYGILEPLGKRLYDFAYAAPKDRGMLKLFVRLRYSPNELVEKAPQIWGDYYTRGKLEIIKNGKKGAKLKLKEFHFEPYEMMIEYMEGYFQAFFEMTGAKEPKVKITRVADSYEPYFNVKVTWK